MNGAKRPGRHSRANTAVSTGSLLEAAAPRSGRLTLVLALLVRWARRALSGWVAGAAALAALATAWLASLHLAPPLAGTVHGVMAAAWIYLLLWLLVLLIRAIPDMLGEMLGEMFVYLILGLLVITLPLLLVPAFRRWVIRQFRGDKRRSSVPGA